MPLTNKQQFTWSRVRDSLWFIPAAVTLLTTALAIAAVGVDRLEWLNPLMEAHWALHSGPEGARVVLSTIAASLMTVTGVVFSITIVALQLASTQFSPRVLGEFLADRGIQFVLGIFIGTFTYALIVLRAVRSDDGGTEVFVPSFAVSLSMLLVIVSIGALIFMINHAARAIQVAVIMGRVRRYTMDDIEAAFPEPVGEPAQGVQAEPTVPDTPPATIEARKAGYLQMVDEDALFAGAEGRRITIRMEPHVGDFVHSGEVMVSVWPPSAADDELRQSVLRAFVIGSERTPEQDVEYGFIELSDIAVKALSPGINDPSTAMSCIDWLGELLVVLGNRAVPQRVRTGEDGELRFISRRPSFDRAVGLAFDQIRHYGVSNPSLARKLLNTIGRVAALVPEDRREPLMEQAEAIRREAQHAVENAGELHSIEQVAGEVRSKVKGGV
jgi:uncharacterized membrane protein